MDETNTDVQTPSTSTSTRSGRLIDRIFPCGFKDDFNLLAKSSIPLILNNLQQVLLPVISLFFCGHLGANELAAVTIANTFVNITAYANILGLTSAGDTLFPQYFGGPEKKKCGLVLQKGLLISMLTFIPLAGILLNIRYLITLFVNEMIIVELADQYIQIILPAIFIYSIHIVIQKYLLSQNIFYPILWINCIGTIICFVASAIGVYQLKMGIAGPAVSVIIANISILLLLLLYIFYKGAHKETWPGWSFECLRGWTDYLSLALPGLGMLLFEWSIFEIGVIGSGYLGKIDISVMSIGIQTIYILFMIPFGIGAGVNIRVGQLLGSNKPDEAKNTCKVATCISAMSSLTAAALVFLFSNYIPMAFTNEPEIVSRAAYLTKFLALCHLADAAQGFAGGIFRAIGAQRYVFFMVLFSFYLIGIPTGLYLMIETKLRVLGFWVGFFVAAFILLIQQIIFISRINWVETARIAHERSVKKEHEHEREVELEHQLEEDEEKGLLPITTTDIEVEGIVIHMPLRDPKSKFYVLMKKLIFLVAFLVFFAASLGLRYELNYSPMFQNYFNLNSTNLTTTTIKP